MFIFATNKGELLIRQCNSVPFIHKRGRFNRAFQMNTNKLWYSQTWNKWRRQKHMLPGTYTLLPFGEKLYVIKKYIINIGKDYHGEIFSFCSFCSRAIDAFFSYPCILECHELNDAKDILIGVH